MYLKLEPFKPHHARSLASNNFCLITRYKILQLREPHELPAGVYVGESVHKFDVSAKRIIFMARSQPMQSETGQLGHTYK